MKLASCKSALNPPPSPPPPPQVVYSSNRSKAVVPVLVLLFIALWFRRFVLSLVLCYFVLVFFSHFSTANTLLGRANLSAFRTFVRFALVWFCLFPFPLSVWEGLRPVIVALPGLFTYIVFHCSMVPKMFNPLKFDYLRFNPLHAGRWI